MNLRDMLSNVFGGLDVDAELAGFTDEELELIAFDDDTTIIENAPIEKRATRTAKKEAIVPKAKKTTKAKTTTKANTGKGCGTLGCTHKLPAKGEAGYSPARRYCVTVCQDARAAAKEADRAEYLRKKGTQEAKKNVRRAEVIAQAEPIAQPIAQPIVQVPVAGKPVPKGTKLDSNGFPEICYVCSGFVPDSVPYAAACSKEYHKLRKSGTRTLTAQQVRVLKNSYPPVGQVHPQGTIESERVERKTKRKMRHPIEAMAVPLPANGEPTTIAAGATVANVERMLRNSEGPEASAMLALLQQLTARA